MGDHLPLSPTLPLDSACACITCSNRLCEAGEQTGGRLGCRSGHGTQVAFCLALCWPPSYVCLSQCWQETEGDPWSGALLLRAWCPSSRRASPGEPAKRRTLAPTQTHNPPRHVNEPQEVKFNKHCHEHANSEAQETLGKPGVFCLLDLSRFSHVPTARRCAPLSGVAFPPFM